MEAGPSRPRRITAEQARFLLQSMEFDEFDDDGSDYEGHNKSNNIDSSGSDGEHELDTEMEDNQARRPPAKRLRAGRNATNNGATADQLPVWTEIQEGQARETENNYRFHPNPPSGILADLTTESTALACLRALFTAQVVQFLLDAVNTHAAHRCQLNHPARRQSVFANWAPVTKSELYKFLAVVIQMGIDHRPSVRDYWAASGAPDHTSWYSSMFQRPRFEALYHSMLHCSEAADATNKDKIEPFMNMLLINYRAAVYPFQNLSLDEMVVGHTKCSIPQSQKNTISRFFGLCDSATGYVLNLLCYFGQNTSYNPDADRDGGQAVKVFSTLLAPFSKGHHIFADRYYAMLKLLEDLSAKGFYYPGTLNTNRRGFPPQIKTSNLAHLQRKWYLTKHKESDILCVAWRDKKAKKPVVVVSTRSSAEMATQPTRRGTSEKPKWYTSTIPI